MRRTKRTFWALVSVLATRMQCSKAPVVVLTDGEQAVVVVGGG